MREDQMTYAVLSALGEAGESYLEEAEPADLLQTVEVPKPAGANVEETQELTKKEGKYR